MGRTAKRGRGSGDGSARLAPVLPRVEGQRRDAYPLNRVQAQQGNARLDELQPEPERDVARHEQLEEVALVPEPPPEAEEGDGEERYEDDLVKLCGVARDAVAEVDGPWK